MLLTRLIAEGVAAGTVSLVFRRWARPDVRAGDMVITSAGVVAVQSIVAVDPATITDADARRAGAASAAALLAALGGRPDGTTYRIEVRYVGPDPRVALSAEDQLSPEQHAEVAARLARLDQRSTHGPWTHALLRLVEANPGRRAVELAGQVGRDRDAVKRDIRKLKNLGLTHSLDVGYRISPRGSAYLAGLPDENHAAGGGPMIIR
ncbi:hypothetical protein ACFP2T_13165 [Plantactinospora solaniradicis]|uniref:ASCH domain-containing protein n=1 Tax=Plantactinospora solaniradicis TaxID=1723736 RepID=A0ABW1K5S9_9ACTN